MSRPQPRPSAAYRPPVDTPRRESPTIPVTTPVSTPRARHADAPARAPPGTPIFPGYDSPRVLASASSSPAAESSRTGRSRTRHEPGTASRSSSIESLSLDDVAEALPDDTIIVDMMPNRAEELKWHRRKEAVSLFNWKRAQWLVVGIPHACSEALLLTIFAREQGQNRALQQSVDDFWSQHLRQINDSDRFGVVQKFELDFPGELATQIEVDSEEMLDQFKKDENERTKGGDWKNIVKVHMDEALESWVPKVEIRRENNVDAQLKRRQRDYDRQEAELKKRSDEQKRKLNKERDAQFSKSSAHVTETQFKEIENRQKRRRAIAEERKQLRRNYEEGRVIEFMTGNPGRSA